MGRLTNANDSVSLARAYLYNRRNELAAATIGTNTFEYAYDTIGNRTVAFANSVTNTYAANALNQYTQIDASQLTYDNDGNLTQDDRFAYTYDAENRLLSVCPLSTTEGSLAVANRYDHKHRRVAKRVERFDGTTWQTLELHTFVYDGGNIILEKIASPDGTTRTIEYFWGNDLSGSEQGAGGVGGLLAVSIDGTFYFPCYDQNGNVVCYVSESGAIAAQYVFDPYGNVIDQYGNMPNQFAFGFCTKYLDRETGLISFLYRFYNPVTGCWLNRDPAEEKGGENLYCYCCNNSLSSFDVQGEVSLSDLKNIMSRLANIRKRLDEVLSSMAECFKVVRSWYPKNARDSETDDKYRHCVASCEIANACGDKISISLGLAKEMRDVIFSLPQNIANGIGADGVEMFLDSFLEGDPFSDNLADLTADVMGIDMKNMKGGCECACKQYYKP